MAPPMAGCPSDEILTAYLERALSGLEHDRVTEHLDACAACRRLFADAASEARTEAEPSGRYVLLETLGAGGMGVVEAAYDRELHRKVALKFLHVRAGGDASGARSSLLREAQALAKLAHPNVVGVHDVGVLDGEVFVAMEFVEGKTLRAWLQAGLPDVDRALAVLGQAGEGLAAAHAVGLVHRDFKPENVLVGADGRVRVTDFGLARPHVPGGGAAADAPVAALDPTVTRTGILAGTPAYMAPEQRRGARGDARSDLYAFCVTLHEAITGARPESAKRGLRRMPAWLERVVARGLADDPSARWGSMRPLLDALAAGPRVTSRRVAGLVAVLGIGAAVVVAGVRQTAPCPPPTHAFDGAWDDAQRAAMTRAFASSGRDSATSVLAYVVGALDGYREAWIRTEVDTCAATRLRGDQSERLLDLRMTCLDDRRRSLARVVSLLSTADSEIVGRSVEIVSGLPSLDGCARIRSLEEVRPLPSSAEDRAVVASGKLALDDARALFHAGKLADARAQLEPAIAGAARVGYAPLLAQLLYWRANVERDLGLDKQCQETLVQAAAQAIEAHDDATLARAWTLFGLEIENRPEQARAWVEQAGAAIRRLGGDDALEGERLLSLGSLELGVARDRARADLLRARELLARTRGGDFYLIASIDQRLGNIAFDEHRIDEAMKYHEQALALRERLFGREHAATVSSIFNVAEDAIARREPAQAREALRELGSRIERHPDLERAWYAIKMGDIARLEHDLPAALDAHRKAVEIYDVGLDPSDPTRALALIEVGRDLIALGRPKEAIPPLRRAEALDAPQGDARAADDRYELACALWDTGDEAGGRELMKKARDGYAAHPEATDASMRVKADAWLASHGQPGRAPE